MKLIKFDLPINGIKVKNLEELRDNLTDEILVLARSSQLERWLRTRQLLAQADAVVKAVKQERTDKGLFLALCKVLEVEAHPDDVKAIFDEPPAPGRFIQSLEKKRGINNNFLSSLDKVMKAAGAISGLPVDNIGFGGFSALRKIRNVKFDSEFLDVKLVNELILNGGCGHAKNVYIKQGGVVLKGSLIAEIGFRSSVIRIYAPVAGVVEKIFVDLGSPIRIGGDVCAIAEKQA